jgi:hypothetical protein
MITEEVIRECETKALQALASVVYDLAGPAPDGESLEDRTSRYNEAGRFLYEMLLGIAQTRAALMATTAAVEAEKAMKQ